MKSRVSRAQSVSLLGAHSVLSLQWSGLEYSPLEDLGFRVLPLFFCFIEIFTAFASGWENIKIGFWFVSTTLGQIDVCPVVHFVWMVGWSVSIWDGLLLKLALESQPNIWCEHIDKFFSWQHFFGQAMKHELQIDSSSCAYCFKD